RTGPGMRSEGSAHSFPALINGVDGEGDQTLERVCCARLEVEIARATICHRGAVQIAIKLQRSTTFAGEPLSGLIGVSTVIAFNRRLETIGRARGLRLYQNRMRQNIRRRVGLASTGQSHDQRLDKRSDLGAAALGMKVRP